MSEIDDPEDGIKITRSYYKALAFFGFLVVLYLCRQILAWDGNKGLIAPMIFFIFFIAYNLNCIDIFIVNNSKIKLMGKYEIEYSLLKKVRRITSVRGNLSYLYYIVYLDMNSRKRIKYFYLSNKNGKYYFLLKKIIDG